MRSLERRSMLTCSKRPKQSSNIEYLASCFDLDRGKNKMYMVGLSGGIFNGNVHKLTFGRQYYSLCKMLPNIPPWYLHMRKD